MRFKTICAAAVVICSATPSLAAKRFYCAANDDFVKLTIESAVRDNRGQELAHFRGVVALQGEDAPPMFRQLQLMSGMLTQYWVDSQKLQLRLFRETLDDEPYSSIDLLVDTRSTDSTNARLDGTYSILVSTGLNKLSEEKKKASHSGRLTCEFK